MGLYRGIAKTKGHLRSHMEAILINSQNICIHEGDLNGISK